MPTLTSMPKPSMPAPARRLTSFRSTSVVTVAIEAHEMAPMSRPRDQPFAMWSQPKMPMATAMASVIAPSPSMPETVCEPTLPSETFAHGRNEPRTSRAALPSIS